MASFPLSVLLVLFAACSAISTEAASTYRAAAVQYAVQYDFPFLPNAQATTVAKNMAQMPPLVLNASAQGAQIVVFPEGGSGYFLANLNGTRGYLAEFCETVPMVTQSTPVVIPCLDESLPASSQLKTMSCAARNATTYVVYNMCDRQPCTPGSGANTTQGECGEDGMYLYDTSVVFDSSGQIVTKYWKYNLFSGDFLFNRLSTPNLDSARFSTDFGVDFAFFICFDISYRDPSVAVLSPGSGERIHNVVFSTDWINSNVFNAVGFQQAYSRAQGVNLIASNSAECPKHCGGGLYNAGFPATTFWYSGEGDFTHTMIGDLPIVAEEAVVEEVTALADVGAVGNVTDCGFGPQSCNVFDTSQTRSGSLRVRGAAGLQCTATFKVAVAPSSSELWALQALDYNNTVPHSPSVQNNTSCLLLRCTIQHHKSTGAPYCYVPEHYEVARTSFSHLSVTLDNLHPDVELFPMFTVQDSRVVSSTYATLTPPRSGGGLPSYTWSTTSQAAQDPQPLFVFGVQGLRSPLHAGSSAPPAAAI